MVIVVFNAVISVGTMATVKYVARLESCLKTLVGPVPPAAGVEFIQLVPSYVNTCPDDGVVVTTSLCVFTDPSALTLLLFDIISLAC